MSSSYDHLTQLLTKVMDEHPNNAVDVFEGMSYEVKRASLNSMQSNLRDLPQLTATELLAEQQRSLFLQSDNEPLDDETVWVSYTCANKLISFGSGIHFKLVF